MAEILKVDILSENMAKTLEGYLVCTNVNISSTQPMDYFVNGVLEQRVKPATELFSIDTIASFEGKPITIGHPENTFVDVGNWKDLAVGFISNVRGADPYLVADLVITDETAIEVVLEQGVREVSIGFTSTLGSERDAVVYRHILGNHLAIVVEGRAGKECSIIDSKGAVMATEAKETPKTGEASQIDVAYRQGVLDTVKGWFKGTDNSETKPTQDAVPEESSATGEVSAEITARFDKLEAMLAEMSAAVTAIMALVEKQPEPAPVADAKQETDAKPHTYLPKQGDASAKATLSLAEMQAELKLNKGSK
jgi:hypothetical protein